MLFQKVPTCGLKRGLEGLILHIHCWWPVLQVEESGPPGALDLRWATLAMEMSCNDSREMTTGISGNVVDGCNCEAPSLARTGITVALLKVHSERKTSASVQTHNI